MKRSVQHLLEQLQGGAILTPTLFDVDVDQVLEAQELEPFETKWLAVHGILESERANLSPDDVNLVNKIAEVAYRRVYELTSNPDAAGSVSDDFELLALALATGHEDPWLNGLWLTFSSGRLPFGEVSRVSGSLESLIVRPAE